MQDKNIFAERVLTEIRSSPEELKSFTNSIIYKDYINELDLRLAETTLLLDDLECKFTGRQYDMFRGRKRNLLEMKLLFIDMINNKISDDLELKEGESNNV